MATITMMKIILISIGLLNILNQWLVFTHYTLWTIELQFTNECTRKIDDHYLCREDHEIGHVSISVSVPGKCCILLQQTAYTCTLYMGCYPLVSCTHLSNITSVVIIWRRPTLYWVHLSRVTICLLLLRSTIITYEYNNSMTYFRTWCCRAKILCITNIVCNLELALILIWELKQSLMK